jgi:hypothetical protein
MRYDRNFNPEWGCVGPAPSAMRTARLIGIAVIIGATVGGATVFSLLDRPVAEESVATRTLVAPDPARPQKVGTSVAAQQPVGAQSIKSPAEAEKKTSPASADGAAAGPQPSEIGTPPTPRHPADQAAFAEATASREASNSPVAVAPDPAPAPKPQTKKSRLTSRTAPRTEGWRYDVRRHDRYFDGPRYRYESRYGYEPRYGSMGSFAWEQY